MYYPLYYDVDIEYGGVWFDPESNDAVVVTDLDSGAGVDGVTMIEMGRLFVEEEMIDQALSVIGEEDKEDAVREVFKRWDERDREGFDRLSDEDQELILRFGEAVQAYAGFDGGADQRFLVIAKDSPHAKRKEKLEDEWGAHESVVSANPGKAIWKLLKDKYEIKR